MRPSDPCREFEDAFERGIKGDALNDHNLSLAATAFSLAETASYYRTACKNEHTTPETVSKPRLYSSISAKANATLNDNKMRETKELE